MILMCNKSRQPAGEWSMNRTKYCVTQSLCHTNKFFQIRLGFPRNYAKLSLAEFPKCETDATSYAQIRWKPNIRWKNGKNKYGTWQNIMKAGFCTKCWKLPISITKNFTFIDRHLKVLCRGKNAHRTVLTQNVTQYKVYIAPDLCIH